MKFSTLKEVLQYYIQEDEDNYWVEDLWKDEITLACGDMKGTLDYLEKDCTDEEFYYFSEVFADIAKQTQSKAFTEALRARLTRVKSEEYDQKLFRSKHIREYVDYEKYVRSIMEEIDFAEGAIENQ